MDWVVISFSRGSFHPRDQTHVSWLQVDSLPLSHLWSPRSRVEFKRLCFFLSFFFLKKKKKNIPCYTLHPRTYSTPHLFCSYPILCLWKPLIYSLYLQVQFFLKILYISEIIQFFSLSDLLSIMPSKSNSSVVNSKIFFFFWLNILLCVYISVSTSVPISIYLSISHLFLIHSSVDGH